MSPGDVAPIVALLAVLATVGGALILRGPLGRALARRIEGSAGPADLDGRLRDLEDRVALGEQERAELVERLDFTERMLQRVEETRKELHR